MSADDFASAAKECAAQFAYLVDDFGFGEPRVQSDASSFKVRFTGARTGVQVDYSTGSILTVWVCQLEAGEWPPRPGRITADTTIHWFDLRDIVTVSTGTEPIVDISAYAIPDAAALAAHAESLRNHGTAMFADDRSLAGRVQDLVKERSRLLRPQDW
jgi:hypothetical protein